MKFYHCFGILSRGTYDFFSSWQSAAGNIIVRQRGSKHNPGANVYISKDHTLHVQTDGVVKFPKKKDNKSYV